MPSIALDCTVWLTTSHAPLSPQVRGLSRQSGLLLLSPQWILFEPEAEELPNKEEELAPSWARDGEPDASEVRLIASLMSQMHPRCDAHDDAHACVEGLMTSDDL